MRITVLGCGSSAGVPLIGCDCTVCQSANPKNKRLRVSLHLETEGRSFLIDASPDLRQQALRHHLRRIDAILFTHDHADHTHGLDDLRSFNYLSGGVLPVFGDAHTLQVLQQRFPYAFLSKPQNIWYRPCLEPRVILDAPVQESDILGVSVTSFHQLHGRSKSLGYRIGDFAYSTDVNALPETAFQALQGTRIWVVDCLRYGESPSHSNLSLTLEWIARVKPELAVLTHMAHDFDYDRLSSELPSGVVPGYDGMVLELDPLLPKTIVSL